MSCVTNSNGAAVKGPRFHGSRNCHVHFTALTWRRDVDAQEQSEHSWLNEQHRYDPRLTFRGGAWCLRALAYTSNDPQRVGGRAFLRGGVAKRRCAPHRSTGLESAAMARAKQVACRQRTHLLNAGAWGYDTSVAWPAPHAIGGADLRPQHTIVVSVMYRI